MPAKAVSLVPPYWFTVVRALASRPALIKQSLRWGYTHCWQLPTRSSVIAKYLANSPIRRLEVGSAFHARQGWLCTDLLAVRPVVYLDVCRRFPLPDNSINYIYSEHMIEHIPYLAAQKMLAECHRVLKPGGKIRIATPDLDVHLHLRTANTAESTEYIHWMNSSSPIAVQNRVGFVINRMFYDWGHCFIYDHEILSDLLVRLGFVYLTNCPVGQSSDPELAGLELHGEDVPAGINAYQTMVIEASKPGD